MATILSWQCVPFWGKNWPGGSRTVHDYFTHSSRRVHDKFTTSSRIVHECVPISVHIETNWHDEFTHSLRIVYALPALARRVHDEFTNSLRIVHDPVAKFCRDQNVEHFKILVPTWHAVTTGSRTLHASSRLVCALARLESCQCVTQNRASVSLA